MVMQTYFEAFGMVFDARRFSLFAKGIIWTKSNLDGSLKMMKSVKTATIF